MQDNFDLRSYLSNNPLLKEDISKLITPFEKPGKSYVGSRGGMDNHEIEININGSTKDGVAWIKDNTIKSLHFLFGKDEPELKSMENFLDKNNIKYNIEKIGDEDGVKLSTTTQIPLSNPDLFNLDENKKNKRRRYSL